MPNLHMRSWETRRGRLFDWWQSGLDLLFPPRCVSCSQVGSWFCADCQAAVQFLPRTICPRCGEPVTTSGLCRGCRASPIALDGVRSVAFNEGTLRHAIHHLKYRGRRELGGVLGRMLFTYWRGADLAADLVIPVPLHPSRKRDRGYNQSGLLAGALAERADLALDEVHLIRARATPPQVGLGAEARQVNVKDAFAWVGDRLTGVRVLLIDDVCTTGATLAACASPLRQAGATAVWALTLARAR